MFKKNIELNLEELRMIRRALLLQAFNNDKAKSDDERHKLRVLADKVLYE